jgi:hypothetical protein
VTLPITAWQAFGAFRHVRPVFDRRIDTRLPQELVKRWQGPAGSYRNGGSRCCCRPSRELAERALADVIGDKAGQADCRSDALAPPCERMVAWARHCEGGVNVLPFKRPAVGPT